MALRKTLVILGIVGMVAIVAAAALGMTNAPRGGETQPRLRKIVVLKTKTPTDKVLRRLERVGGRKTKDLPIADAIAVDLPNEAAARRLAEDPGVEKVEDDLIVKVVPGKALGRKRRTPTQPAQQVPWGVDKIDAEKVWATTTGDPIKVAIIDTGIDATHPDLAGNIKGGVSEVAYTTSFNDDNGHGSHVAGTVASLDNTIGVVGVGPKIDLYAVKVLDRNGSGYLSDVIAGIDWAVANGMQVANMSLGTSGYSSAFDQAVQSASTAGLVQACAAGNSGPGSNTVSYPGKFPSVICVGATDSSDVIASFSSRGPEVDVSAPGVSVYSTYAGSRYATLSGTSMATPHVAGTAALVLTTAVSGYDANGNGTWDPAEVRKRLQDTALDLGTAGSDTAYGYGRIRADLATGVTP